MPSPPPAPLDSCAGPNALTQSFTETGTPKSGRRSNCSSSVLADFVSPMVGVRAGVLAAFVAPIVGVRAGCRCGARMIDSRGGVNLPCTEWAK